MEDKYTKQTISKVISIYRCQQCSHEFSIEGSSRSIKVSMPKCPACNGLKVELIKKTI